MKDEHQKQKCHLEVAERLNTVDGKLGPWFGVWKNASETRDNPGGVRKRGIANLLRGSNDSVDAKVPTIGMANRTDPHEKAGDGPAVLAHFEVVRVLKNALHQILAKREVNSFYVGDHTSMRQRIRECCSTAEPL